MKLERSGASLVPATVAKFSRAYSAQLIAAFFKGANRKHVLAQEGIQIRRSRQMLTKYPRAIPVAIFVLIAAITLVSVYSIESGAQSREQAQLRERAKAVASALERRGATVSSYLRAGAALFGTVDEISPGLFNRFVSNLQVEATERGTDGIGWAPRLRPDQVDVFSRRYKELTGYSFDAFPRVSSTAERVAPVAFMRPDNERNDRAIGFDLYSDPASRTAMEEAIRLADPVATDKIVLQQEGIGNDPGFAIFMPVFEPGRSPQRVKGFIFAPFNAHDFMASALLLETRGERGLRLYDRELGPGRLLVELPGVESTGITVTEPVTIGNHDMVLEVESAHGNSLSALSLATLLFGILVASLLMVLVRLLTRQAHEDYLALGWLEEQNSIRDTLTRELNHRVKNTLANVLSIISLTRRRASSLDDFADSLDGRIRALSATHDLLTQSEWGTTPIRSLVEAELAPYARQNDALLEIVGPELEIAPNDALSLGLAIHELSTNAAKYGSLSTAGGKVSVTWEQVSDEYATINWAESGGPEVLGKRASGFGTNLIEKIVAHELRNPVMLKFEPTGVTCSLTVPLRKPNEFAMRAQRDYPGG